MRAAPPHHVSCVADDQVCQVLVGLDVTQHLLTKQLVMPQPPLRSVEARVAVPAAASMLRTHGERRHCVTRMCAGLALHWQQL